MRRTLALLLLAAAGPLGAAHAGPAPAPAAPVESATAWVPVPADATRVSSTEIDELRARSTSTTPPRTNHGTVERVVGIQARDDVYQSSGRYGDVVAFYDRRLAQEGFASVQRDVKGASTSWIARRPDGTIASVLVRDTRPVAIETVQALAAPPPTP